MNVKLKADAHQQQFIDQLGIKHPIIGGPMYPCSNPELVAAVSEAGGIGIVQPLSLTYVYGHDFKQGLKLIKTLTKKPIGMNALIEKSSRRYQQRMAEWLDIALEEDVRFFITSLGKPDWVVKKVHAAGGQVYHDVTEKKWASKAIDCGVDGFIAVNNRAGGHAGMLNQEQLLHDLSIYKLPVICAGGIGNPMEYKNALKQGYAGIQMGTRFIASKECRVLPAYKSAIVDASENDIVLSEKVTGIPVSIIRRKYIEKTGTTLNAASKLALRFDVTKPIYRTFLALKSMWQLKRASVNSGSKTEYWQAGKSVKTIIDVKSVDEIISSFVRETRK